MLHSHNSLAGDLHVSIRHVKTLALEKRAASRRRHVLPQRDLSTATRVLESTLKAVSEVSTRKDAVCSPGKVPGPQPTTFKTIGICSTLKSPLHSRARSFSHKASGYRGPLPNGSPFRNSPTPTRQRSQPPPSLRGRKAPNQASVLRNNTVSKDVLKDVQSPDVEREQNENRLLALKREQDEERERERMRQEELENQERIMREKKEAEYQHRVAEPIVTLHQDLDYLIEQLPASVLQDYLVATRARAHQRWQQLYNEQVKRPLARFSAELDRISLDLFPASDLRDHLLTIRVQALERWQQLYDEQVELPIAGFFAELDRISCDMKNFPEIAATTLRQAKLSAKVEYAEILKARQEAILTTVPRYVAEFRNSKSQGVHHTTRALVNKLWSATFDTSRCLSDTTLLNIRRELVGRGKWTLVDQGERFPRCSLGRFEVVTG